MVSVERLGSWREKVSGHIAWKEQGGGSDSSRGEKRVWRKEVSGGDDTDCTTTGAGGRDGQDYDSCSTIYDSFKKK